MLYYELPNFEQKTIEIRLKTSIYFGVQNLAIWMQKLPQRVTFLKDLI